ncbi:ABC transporter substrate-binding protein [Parasaccharibacter sp. TMW2.1882]|uniref:MlaD family protein n=1 Tax=Bombella apis TaxID=1785988 RepID=UPI0012B72BA0|nr:MULTISPECIES: MlaD family protein [Acetobacteraceae]MCK8636768.1 ABC transporter substrate-binding protein [Parasaccharibacter sp. TMW2.1885]MCL1496120.1 ABC transporter substrate-binding protein [Parasaccharibacter sp. TMW2.1882]MPW00298.1 MCE family protein [Bombella apis]
MRPLRLRRRSGLAAPLFRSSFVDEWVGLLVLLALVILTAVLVEAGFLKQWLTPAGRLHFVLPESGVAGLAVNNDIEVMGVRVGEIRRLDLNESGRMYAEGTIEPHFERYIRSDSIATIKRRLVVAGAGYIEITRGQGEPLNWDYAVLNTSVEPNPADMIVQTLIDLRARLLPAMDNVEEITKQAKDIMVDLHAGKGTAGALLTNEETAQRVNTILVSLNKAIEAVQPLEQKLQITLNEANGVMQNVHGLTKGLKDSGPEVQRSVRNVADATEQLPAVLAEAEATADSLRKLSDQLRGLWLLGGSGGKNRHRPDRRLPAREVRP